MGKLLPVLLLLVGFAHGQSPMASIRLDSLPEVRSDTLFLPDIHTPFRRSPGMMPTSRPRNSFYRYPTELPNVVRATLDNMPVKVPDTSTYYTMMRSFKQPYRLVEPPAPLPKMLPPDLPKKH
ncbi:hypothetical protein [Spirosoma linguale]|uniref:Uncharacterized protein n=1 Tax=Spirosoma linguale (strain ATCC 33905 / DSM 74 / LMG 10896 / Claus 1) TaxID=504472 RepID=D2QNU9_SPILD|nr:hypothetical protein Slin_1505 [Spirosoma linguale DSM 74]